MWLQDVTEGSIILFLQEVKTKAQKRLETNKIKKLSSTTDASKLKNTQICLDITKFKNTNTSLVLNNTWILKNV